MRIHCVILSILILFLSASIVLGQDVNSVADVNKLSVENGNIYFSADRKNRTQLTSTGKDRAPVLSPDEKRVVFIRKSNNKAYCSGSDKSYSPSPDELLADQLWIVDVNDKKEKMLVKDWNPDTDDPNGSVASPMTKMISHIHDDSLYFSPDGTKIYFITSAWVTSGAVHSVDIDGTNEHFVIAGNSLEVIDRGRYKGNLIVQQHRYFAGCGSYDWFWLFTPEGKVVGPLGENLAERKCLDIN